MTTTPDTTTATKLVSPDVFRAVMGSFASGITVVTSVADGKPRGMTVTAVCSVSADPPMLLSCFKKPSGTLDAIDALGYFAVNFLDAEARGLSNVFAGRGPDRFSQVSWRPGIAGVPLLAGTVAHAECVVQERLDAGDHVIVLGGIVGGGVDPHRLPLGYWRGSYVRLFRMSRPRPAGDAADSPVEWSPGC